MKGESGYSQRKNIGLYHQQTHPKRVAKGSSWNRKDIIKGGILEHQEGKIEGAKVWVNTTDVPSLFEFYKLCLMIEAKSVTLSDVLFHVEEIFKTIINWGG